MAKAKHRISIPRISERPQHVFEAQCINGLSDIAHHISPTPVDSALLQSLRAITVSDRREESCAAKILSGQENSQPSIDNGWLFVYPSIKNGGFDGYITRFTQTYHFGST